MGRFFATVEIGFGYLGTLLMSLVRYSVLPTNVVFLQGVLEHTLMFTGFEEAEDLEHSLASTTDDRRLSSSHFYFIYHACH